MNKLDRNRIKTAVIETLHLYGKQLSLPVKIKALTKGSYKNLRLIPYSVQMKRRGLSYDEMLAFSGTEDACTDYNAKSDMYIIYYNDVDPLKVSSNRYRWNIAHELGHIALNHHKNYAESRIYRNGLGKALYKVLEDEADMFAAYLLVPHIVISCVCNKNSIDVASLCKISDLAASYRLDSIKQWSRSASTEKYDVSILGSYSIYVEKYKYSGNVRKWLNEHRACSHCKSSFKYRFGMPCQICGEIYTGNYEMIEDIMTYKGIDQDDKGRALECPVCHNTEISESGDFCKICGTSLVNMCSEANEDVSYTCRNIEPLPGNARFCPLCGSKTTYYVRNFIPAWNDPMEPECKVEDGELPF